MKRTEPDLTAIDAELPELHADPLLYPRDPLRTPKGMGDLLPPEADARRRLTRAVLRAFQLWGYDLIVTPLFEHAEVVERGIDALDPRDLLRFVEPESGEVAVLRSSSGLECTRGRAGTGEIDIAGEHDHRPAGPSHG